MSRLFGTATSDLPQSHATVRAQNFFRVDDQLGLSGAKWTKHPVRRVFPAVPHCSHREDSDMLSVFHLSEWLVTLTELGALSILPQVGGEP
jgi:hypothetical protein